MGESRGRVIINAGADVWPHELATERRLAETGRDVEFPSKTIGPRVTSPDIIMNGIAWEMKSPESRKLAALERNLRKSKRQSPNVIIDAARMKGISDADVEDELRRLRPLVRSVKRLLLVKKSGEVVDIS